VAKIDLSELTKGDDQTSESCAVCGSTDVTDLGLVPNTSLTEIDLVAWCDKDECQNDLRESLGAVLLIQPVEGDRYRLAPPPAAL
jgi:hypothetical protein